MRVLLSFLATVIIATSVLTMSQPTRADAHGIGGVEPSTSSAHVTSVDPATQDFAIISIENGSRVKLRKLGNTDIIVLGVSSEPYIKISSQGTFLNQKSATRLINQSTSGSTTAQNETKEFAQTSDDPNTPPVWKKCRHQIHTVGTITVHTIWVVLSRTHRSWGQVH